MKTYKVVVASSGPSGRYEFQVEADRFLEGQKLIKFYRGTETEKEIVAVAPLKKLISITVKT